MDYLDEVIPLLCEESLITQVVSSEVAHLLLVDMPTLVDRRSIITFSLLLLVFVFETFPRLVPQDIAVHQVASGLPTRDHNEEEYQEVLKDVPYSWVLLEIVLLRLLSFKGYLLVGLWLPKGFRSKVAEALDRQLPPLNVASLLKEQMLKHVNN